MNSTSPKTTWNKTTFLLIAAIVLFALSSPVIKLLVKKGGEFGLEHPDAISFCNILFIANLCSGIIVLASFGTKGILKEFLSLSRKTYFYLSISIVLAFLYPATLFTALESTTVTNVILLSRFEGIFYALLAWVVYKKSLNKFELSGLAIIGIGISALIYIDKMYMATRGELLVIVAAVFYAFAVWMSKETLKHCSVRLFLFARNFFSAIAFFVVAIYLYGADHFADAFSGELWILMAIYGLFVIVIGQYMWYEGIKTAEPNLISNINLSYPFLALAFAFFLLGENPGTIQIIAIGIILSGMLISKIKSKSTKDDTILEVDKSMSGG